MEISGDNFLIPALTSLCQNTRNIPEDEIQAARSNLCSVLKNRFQGAFDSIDNHHNTTDLDNRNAPSGMDIDEQATGSPDTLGAKRKSGAVYINDYEDDDDEDAPVVVSSEEIEASVTRSSYPSDNSKSSMVPEKYPPSMRRKYPMLFAAKMEHEDIMMTCARALDEASDVSLVREAGTFLVEEVEPEMAE